MNRIKSFIKYVTGYDSEYTKREMGLFTRTVLILLIFNIPLFCILYYTHMRYGLSANLVKIFWTNYLGFCKILISGYSVTFIGQMGKAYLSKKEEENVKLKRQLNKLKESDGEE